MAFTKDDLEKLRQYQPSLESSPYKTGAQAFQQSQQDNNQGGVLTNAAYNPDYGKGTKKSSWLWGEDTVDANGKLTVGGDTVDNKRKIFGYELDEESDTVGFFNSLIDAAQGGALNMTGGALKFVGDTFNTEWMNRLFGDEKKKNIIADFLESGGDYLNERAAHNQIDPNLTENDKGQWWASAIGNAVGSSVPTMIAYAALTAAAPATAAGTVAGLGMNAQKVATASKLLGSTRAFNLATKLFGSGKTINTLSRLHLAQKLGNLPEALSEAGQAIEDADRQGKKGWDRFAQKWGTAAANLVFLEATDRFGAGAQNYVRNNMFSGKGIAGFVPKFGEKGWGRFLAESAAFAPASSFKEGAEEFGQNMIQAYASKGRIDQDDLKQGWEEAKMGAAGGLFLGPAMGAVTGKGPQGASTTINGETYTAIPRGFDPKTGQNLGTEYTITPTGFLEGMYRSMKGDEGTVSSEEFYDRMNKAAEASGEDSRATIDRAKTVFENMDSTGGKYVGLDAEAQGKYNEAVHGLRYANLNDVKDDKNKERMIYENGKGKDLRYIADPTLEEVDETIKAWENVRDNHYDRVDKRTREEVNEDLSKARAAYAVQTNKTQNNEKRKVKEQITTDIDDDALSPKTPLGYTAREAVNNLNDEEATSVAKEAIDWIKSDKSPFTAQEKENLLKNYEEAEDKGIYERGIIQNAMQNGFVPESSLEQNKARIIANALNNAKTQEAAIDNAQKAYTQQSAAQQAETQNDTAADVAPEITVAPASTGKAVKGNAVQGRKTVRHVNGQALQIDDEGWAKSIPHFGARKPAGKGKVGYTYTGPNGLSATITESNANGKFQGYRVLVQGKDENGKKVSNVLNGKTSPVFDTIEQAEHYASTRTQGNLKETKEEFVKGYKEQQKPKQQPKQQPMEKPKGVSTAMEKAAAKDTKELKLADEIAGLKRDGFMPLTGAVRYTDGKGNQIAVSKDAKTGLWKVSSFVDGVRKTSYVQRDQIEQEIKDRAEAVQNSETELSKLSPEERSAKEQEKNERVLDWSEQSDTSRVAYQTYSHEDRNALNKAKGRDQTSVHGIEGMTNLAAETFQARITQQIVNAGCEIVTNSEKLADYYTAMGMQNARDNQNGTVTYFDPNDNQEHTVNGTSGYAVVDGKIDASKPVVYVADGANWLDIPAHEYGHFWWKKMFGKNPDSLTGEKKKLYDDIVAAIKETKMYKDISADPIYKDYKVEEAFCRLLGNYSLEGAYNPNFEKEVLAKKGKLRRLFDKFFNFVRKLFGLEPNREGATGLTEFLNMPLREVFAQSAENTENADEITEIVRGKKKVDLTPPEAEEVEEVKNSEVNLDKQSIASLVKKMNASDVQQAVKIAEKVREKLRDEYKASSREISKANYMNDAIQEHLDYSPDAESIANVLVDSIELGDQYQVESALSDSIFRENLTPSEQTTRSILAASNLNTRELDEALDAIRNSELPSYEAVVQSLTDEASKKKQEAARDILTTPIKGAPKFEDRKKKHRGATPFDIASKLGAKEEIVHSNTAEDAKRAWETRQAALEEYASLLYNLSDKSISREDFCEAFMNAYGFNRRINYKKNNAAPDSFIDGVNGFDNTSSNNSKYTQPAELVVNKSFERALLTTEGATVSFSPEVIFGKENNIAGYKMTVRITDAAGNLVRVDSVDMFPKKSGKKDFSFQVQDIMAMEKALFDDKNPAFGFLNTYEAGYGKTYITTAFLRRVLDVQKDANVVIMYGTETTAKSWRDALDAYGISYYDINNTKVKANPNSKKGRVCLTSYASVGKAADENWNYVIADESQNIESASNAKIDIKDVTPPNKRRKYFEQIIKSRKNLSETEKKSLREQLKQAKLEENKELVDKLEKALDEYYTQDELQKIESRPKVVYISATPAPYLENLTSYAPLINNDVQGFASDISKEFFNVIAGAEEYYIKGFKELNDIRKKVVSAGGPDIDFINRTVSTDGKWSRLIGFMYGKTPLIDPVKVDKLIAAAKRYKIPMTSASHGAAYANSYKRLKDLFESNPKTRGYIKRDPATKAANTGYYLIAYAEEKLKDANLAENLKDAYKEVVGKGISSTTLDKVKQELQDDNIVGGADLINDAIVKAATDLKNYADANFGPTSYYKTEIKRINDAIEKLKNTLSKLYTSDVGRIVSDLQHLTTDSPATAGFIVSELKDLAKEIKTNEEYIREAIKYFTVPKDASGNPILDKDGNPLTSRALADIHSSLERMHKHINNKIESIDNLQCFKNFFIKHLLAKNSAGKSKLDDFLNSSFRGTTYANILLSPNNSSACFDLYKFLAKVLDEKQSDGRTLAEKYGISLWRDPSTNKHYLSTLDKAYIKEIVINYLTKKAKSSKPAKTDWAQVFDGCLTNNVLSKGANVWDGFESDYIAKYGTNKPRKLKGGAIVTFNRIKGCIDSNSPLQILVGKVTFNHIQYKFGPNALKIDLISAMRAKIKEAKKLALTQEERFHYEAYKYISGLFNKAFAYRPTCVDMNGGTVYQYSGPNNPNIKAFSNSLKEVCTYIEDFVKIDELKKSKALTEKDVEEFYRKYGYTQDVADAIKKGADKDAAAAAFKPKSQEELLENAFDEKLLSILQSTSKDVNIADQEITAIFDKKNVGNPVRESTLKFLTDMENRVKNITSKAEELFNQRTASPDKLANENVDEAIGELEPLIERLKRIANNETVYSQLSQPSTPLSNPAAAKAKATKLDARHKIDLFRNCVDSYQKALEEIKEKVKQAIETQQKLQEEYEDLKRTKEEEAVAVYTSVMDKLKSDIDEYSKGTGNGAAYTPIVNDLNNYRGDIQSILAGAPDVQLRETVRQYNSGCADLRRNIDDGNVFYTNEKHALARTLAMAVAAHNVLAKKGVIRGKASTTPADAHFAVNKVSFGNATTQNGFDAFLKTVVGSGSGLSDVFSVMKQSVSPANNVGGSITSSFTLLTEMMKSENAVEVAAKTLLANKNEQVVFTVSRVAELKENPLDWSEDDIKAVAFARLAQLVEAKKNGTFIRTSLAEESLIDAYEELSDEYRALPSATKAKLSRKEFIFKRFTESKKYQSAFEDTFTAPLREAYNNWAGSAEGKAVIDYIDDKYKGNSVSDFIKSLLAERFKGTTLEGLEDGIVTIDGSTGLRTRTEYVNAFNRGYFINGDKKGTKCRILIGSANTIREGVSLDDQLTKAEKDSGKSVPIRPRRMFVCFSPASPYVWEQLAYRTMRADTRSNSVLHYMTLDTESENKATRKFAIHGAIMDMLSRGISDGENILGNVNFLLYNKYNEAVSKSIVTPEDIVRDTPSDNAKQTGFVDEKNNLTLDYFVKNSEVSREEVRNLRIIKRAEGVRAWRATRELIKENLDSLNQGGSVYEAQKNIVAALRKIATERFTYDDAEKYFLRLPFYRNKLGKYVAFKDVIGDQVSKITNPELEQVADFIIRGAEIFRSTKKDIKGFVYAQLKDGEPIPISPAQYYLLKAWYGLRDSQVPIALASTRSVARRQQAGALNSAEGIINSEQNKIARNILRDIADRKNFFFALKKMAGRGDEVRWYYKFTAKKDKYKSLDIFGEDAFGNPISTGLSPEEQGKLAGKIVYMLKLLGKDQNVNLGTEEQRKAAYYVEYNGEDAAAPVAPELTPAEKALKELNDERSRVLARFTPDFIDSPEFPFEGDRIADLLLQGNGQSERDFFEVIRTESDKLKGLLDEIGSDIVDEFIQKRNVYFEYAKAKYKKADNLIEVKDRAKSLGVIDSSGRVIVPSLEFMIQDAVDEGALDEEILDRLYGVEEEEGYSERYQKWIKDWNIPEDVADSLVEEIDRKSGFAEYFLVPDIEDAAFAKSGIAGQSGVDIYSTDPLITSYATTTSNIRNSEIEYVEKLFPALSKKEAKELSKKLDPNLDKKYEQLEENIAKFKETLKFIMPKGTKIERYFGNRLLVEAPNGAKIVVDFYNKSIRNAKAIETIVRDYGVSKDAASKGKVKASWTLLKKDGLDGWLNIYGNVEDGVVYHEVAHAVRDLCLTKKENAVLDKHIANLKKLNSKFSNMDNEEVLAELVRTTKANEKTILGKIINKIYNFVSRLESMFNGMESAYDIIQDINSGAIWYNPKADLSGKKAGKTNFFFVSPDSEDLKVLARRKLQTPEKAREYSFARKENERILEARRALRNAAMAKRLYIEGRSQREILLKTGCMLDVDGAWKYWMNTNSSDIDISCFKVFSSPNINTIINNEDDKVDDNHDIEKIALDDYEHSIPFGRIYKNDALYTLAPYLKTIPIKLFVSQEGDYGGFNYDTGVGKDFIGINILMFANPNEPTFSIHMPARHLTEDRRKVPAGRVRTIGNEFVLMYRGSILDLGRFRINDMEARVIPIREFFLLDDIEAKCKEKGVFNYLKFLYEQNAFNFVSIINHREEIQEMFNKLVDSSDDTSNVGLMRDWFERYYTGCDNPSSDEAPVFEYAKKLSKVYVNNTTNSLNQLGTTLFHETQHAVQNKEGFAAGSNSIVASIDSRATQRSEITEKRYERLSNKANESFAIVSEHYIKLNDALDFFLLQTKYDFDNRDRFDVEKDTLGSIIKLKSSPEDTAMSMAKSAASRLTKLYKDLCFLYTGKTFKPGYYDITVGQVRTLIEHIKQLGADYEIMRSSYNVAQSKTRQGTKYTHINQDIQNYIAEYNYLYDKLKKLETRLERSQNTAEKVKLEQEIKELQIKLVPARFKTSVVYADLRAFIAYTMAHGEQEARRAGKLSAADSNGNNLFTLPTFASVTRDVIARVKTSQSYTDLVAKYGKKMKTAINKGILKGCRGSYFIDTEVYDSLLKGLYSSVAKEVGVEVADSAFLDLASVSNRAAEVLLDNMSSVDSLLTAINYGFEDDINTFAGVTDIMKKGLGAEADNATPAETIFHGNDETILALDLEGYEKRLRATDVNVLFQDRRTDNIGATNGRRTRFRNSAEEKLSKTSLIKNYGDVYKEKYASSLESRILNAVEAMLESEEFKPTLLTNSKYMIRTELESGLKEIKDELYSAMKDKKFVPQHTKKEMEASFKAAVKTITDSVVNQITPLSIRNSSIDSIRNSTLSPADAQRQKELWNVATGAVRTQASQSFWNQLKDSPAEKVSKIGRDIYVAMVDKYHPLHTIDDWFAAFTGVHLLSSDGVYEAAQGGITTAAGVANTLTTGSKAVFKYTNKSLELEGTENELNPLGTTENCVKKFHEVFKSNQMAKDFCENYADGDEVAAAGRYLTAVTLFYRNAVWEQMTAEKTMAAVAAGRVPAKRVPYKMPKIKVNGVEMEVTIEDVRNLLKEVGWEFRETTKGGYRHYEAIREGDVFDQGPLKNGKRDDKVVRDTALGAYRELNNNLQKLLCSQGCISTELKNALRDDFPDYAPLMRDFRDTAAMEGFFTGLTAGGTGIGNVKAMLHRICKQGSDRPVINPLEISLKSTAIAANRAIRNRTGLRLVNMVRAARKVAEARAQKTGVPVNDNDFPIKEMPMMYKKKSVGGVTVNIPVNANANPLECIFTVMEDGVRKAYKSTPELYQSIVGYNSEMASVIAEIAMKPAAWMRYGSTMAPAFIIRNFLRDTVFASVASENGFIMGLSSLKGAYKLLTDKEFKARFKSTGIGEFNYYWDGKRASENLTDMIECGRAYQYTQTKKEFGKMIQYAMQCKAKLAAKSLGKGASKASGLAKDSVFDFFENLSEFAEASTRAGEFDLAYNNAIDGKVKDASGKARKMSESEAMHYAAICARNITLDFSRSGSTSRQINRFVPFFNAAIQGSDKMWRLCTDEKTRARTWTKLMTNIVLPTIGLWLLQNADPDDPDKRLKINSGMRYSNWLIPLGDGSYARIPKPQEAGVTFGSLVEAFLDFMLLEEPEAMSNWAHEAYDVLMPEMLPTIISPLWEWKANYNNLVGKPIVAKRLQDLESKDQYTPSTSEIAKLIAEGAQGTKFEDWFGMSPMKIENTIRGYFGTMGYQFAHLLSMLTPSFWTKPDKDLREHYPFRDFVTNDYNLSEYTTQYYATTQKLTRKANSERVSGSRSQYDSLLGSIRQGEGKRINRANKELRDIEAGRGKYEGMSTKDRQQLKKEQNAIIRANAESALFRTNEKYAKREDKKRKDKNAYKFLPSFVYDALKKK